MANIEDQKHAILRRIEEEYYSRSIGNAKMESIAASAGFKKSALYHYFPTKEDLILELIEFSFREYQSRLKDVMSRDDIRELIDWQLFFPYESKNYFGILYFGKMPPPEKFSEVVNKKIETIRHAYCGYLQERYRSEEKRYLAREWRMQIGKKMSFEPPYTHLNRKELVDQICKFLEM